MHFDQLTRINAPDFIPRDSVRLPDGTLIIAGQTGITEADRRARPQTPTEAVADGGALIYGTRAPGPRPPQLTPTGLGFTDIMEVLPGDILRVDSEAVLASADDNGLHQLTIGLHNAQTGVAAIGMNGAYPSPDDGSYILNARYIWLFQDYQWPADWARVSGAATPPDWYSWRHPTLGVVQYDPIYAVGALPFNAGDPRQARLLDAREEAVESGAAKRHREWDGKLIIFDEDGDQIGFDGEMAAVRIIVGDGDWIGDENVHPNATLGTALLKSDENGELVPWTIEPRLRAANALLLEGETLWIGGMRATRDGREPVILNVSTDTGEVIFCARATAREIPQSAPAADGLQNNGVTGIMRGWDGVLRVWTPDARYRLRQFFGVWILESDGDDEGRGDAVGGTCPTVALGAGGSSVEVVAIEHPYNLNDGVLQIRCGGSVNNWINGVPLARLGGNVLASWAGEAWGLWKTSAGTTWLSSTDSGGWKLRVSFSERRRERLVARAGKYLVVVGEDVAQVNAGVFANSTISRFSKDTNLHFAGHFDIADFQLRSIHETVSLDGKRDSALFIGEDADGFAVWESDGRTDLEIGAQNIADGVPGFNHARAAFELLDAATPGGCELYFARVPFSGELSAWGAAWGDELAAWIESADFPSVWFAPDLDYAYDDQTVLSKLEGVTELAPVHAIRGGGIYWPRKRARESAMVIIIAPAGITIEAPVKAVY